MESLTNYFKKYNVPTMQERQVKGSEELDFPMAPDPRKLPPAPARTYSEGLLKVMRRDPEIVPSGEVKLLPEYEKYVEENYPPMVWDPEGHIYFKIVKEHSKILGYVPAIVAYWASQDELLIVDPIDEITYLTRNEKFVGEAIKKLVERKFGITLRYPIRVRREERNGDGVYVYDELIPATDLFMRHVEEGLIRDEKGRMLSDTEVQGKPPSGGFLNQFDNILLGPSKDWRENIPYYPGLVVKICGDYRPDLAKEHNTWAVITRVLDPYRYEVIQEETEKKLILRDTDVKGIIGDYKNDFIGLGRERHEREVKPLILKILRKYAKESMLEQ